MEFVYKKYSSEYKGQVIELMQFLWDFDKSLWRPYFEWKFEKNPYTDEPLAFVALDGDKVVAFRGYMVLPIQKGDKRYLCAILADTVTHGSYQRMGLFIGVTKFSIQEILKDERYLVSLNSSSGGKTLNGYLKLRWKPLCEREYLFKFSLGGILKKILNKKYNECNTSKDLKEGKYELSDICKAKDISAIPYNYNYFSHIREEKLYEWRFQNPKERYKFAYSYDQNGLLKSYIVLFKTSEGKWDLVDFNTVNGKELNKLLNWACCCLKPLFVTLWTVGKENVIYKNSCSFGFLPLNMLLRKNKKFQKPPFLVREFSQSEHDSVFDSSRWDLYKIIADEI